MNAILLLIPFFLIRFGIMSAADKGAIERAAHFAPLLGIERSAYYIYQISNTAIFIYLCFLTIHIDFSWQFWLGLVCYVTGLILCTVSVINFAKPSDTGINTSGIYSFSRNPMYLSYFVYFIGCALLTHSLILCGLVLVFQISAHWIILAEERWCREKFGGEYTDYMKKVRRYI